MADTAASVAAAAADDQWETAVSIQHDEEIKAVRTFLRNVDMMMTSTAAWSLPPLQYPLGMTPQRYYYISMQSL